MTEQALNSLELYKHQDPSKIKQLLMIQSISVVNELMEHVNASDIDELAVKLSVGF